MLGVVLISGQDSGSLWGKIRLSPIRFPVAASTFFTFS